MMAHSVGQNSISGISIEIPLTKKQAKEIYSQGEEAVVFALLKLSKLLAQQHPLQPSIGNTEDPSCPSGQKPVFTKLNKKDGKKRRKKASRHQGRPGSRRNQPERTDRTEEHRASKCPDCSSKLKECTGSRERYVEDILKDVRIEVTIHVIHRDWCPACRKMAEPVVPDALPKATIGNGILVLSGWLHFALGNTISQILEVFNFHLQFKMSAGGLVGMWHRLADILEAWYEEISEDILKSGVLHGDETGWRVDGKTSWLWCFTSRVATIFTIDRSRGSPVVLEFIKECFQGVFVSDFWHAYNVLSCAKQKCLAHLLRELKRVWQYKDVGGDWPISKSSNG